MAKPRRRRHNRPAIDFKVEIGTKGQCSIESLGTFSGVLSICSGMRWQHINTIDITAFRDAERRSGSLSMQQGLTHESTYIKSRRSHLPSEDASLLRKMNSLCIGTAGASQNFTLLSKQSSDDKGYSSSVRWYGHVQSKRRAPAAQYFCRLVES